MKIPKWSFVAYSGSLPLPILKSNMFCHLWAVGQLGSQADSSGAQCRVCRAEPSIFTGFSVSEALAPCQS